MNAYVSVNPDIEDWFKFAEAAQNMSFDQGHVTVQYDEFAPDLPVEVILVDRNGHSFSVYLSDDAAYEYRMDRFAYYEANAVANTSWKE